MKIYSISTLIVFFLLALSVSAQENLQRGALVSGASKSFRTVKELPITSVKNQHRSGTCWAYGTLGFFESEILRQTGKTYDLCEMFVVNRDYMDCATHYVRMHGFSQISEGGSCDDVLDVIRHYGICPEEAMPAPGSLTGDSLANFKVFFPELERTVSGIVRKDVKEPRPHWQDSVQAVIERYVGRCPESFVYEGQTYTPRSFAESLGLDLDDYVSLTSFTHHSFGEWFVIESPYKWRLKPSYNIPIEQLKDVLDAALDAGYPVAWGGDVSGDFTRTGLAMLPDSVQPTQQLRQEQWDDWRFTYDHVMLIYGKAIDENGKPFYMVKNSWGRFGQYDGTWYMSRDFMALNTVYLFLNRHALPELLRAQLMCGPVDVLKDKQIGVIGDSYVRNHREPVENTWHYKFAQKHQMRYFNYGRNGNCISLDLKQWGTGLYKRYAEMKDSLDYVVVIAGHNDGRVGRIDSIGVDVFKERLGILCKGLIAKYPRAKIFFFTPWTCKDFVGSLRQQVVDAMLEVCGSYGIPVFDAARNSNIYAADEQFRKIYFQGGKGTDEAHLNAKGHDRFLPVAEHFILQYEASH